MFFTAAISEPKYCYQYYQLVRVTYNPVFTARQHRILHAERCISYDRFRLSVRLSVSHRLTAWYHVKMTQVTIMWFPL